MNSSEKHKRNRSEIIQSKILKGSKDYSTENSNNAKSNYKSKNNQEESRDFFADSFTEHYNKGKNINLNFEDNSLLDVNFCQKSGNNKTVIKTIVSRFHDLFVKMALQIKQLENENLSLRSKVISKIRKKSFFT